MKSFYLPEELQKIIQDFSRPITRIRWRKGSAYNNTLRPCSSERMRISSYKAFKNYLHECAYTRYFIIVNDISPINFFREKALQNEFVIQKNYCLNRYYDISPKYVAYCIKQNYKCVGCNQTPCCVVQEQHHLLNLS